jgi:hypothetical protein
VFGFLFRLERSGGGVMYFIFHRLSKRLSTSLSFYLRLCRSLRVADSLVEGAYRRSLKKQLGKDLELSVPYDP